MIETQDGYDFEIYGQNMGAENAQCGYVIYVPVYSSEVFDSEQQARYAAIGHIALLQKEQKHD